MYGAEHYIVKPDCGLVVDPSHPLVQRMVACWAVDTVAEASALLVRDVWGTFDGVINLSTITPWYEATFGQGLQSVNTASTTAGVTINNSSTLTFASTDLAIDAWVVLDGGAGGFQPMLTQANVGFFINNRNLYWDAWGTPIAGTGNSLPLQEICHIGFTGLGTNSVSFYINGLLDVTTVASAPGTSITFNTMLNDNVAETFVGKLLMMRLYKGQLRASDMWELSQDMFGMFDMQDEYTFSAQDVPEKLSRRLLVNVGI